LAIGTAAVTVAAMSCDTTSANPGDEPSVGTSPFTFTTRANAVTSNSGAGRVETAAAAANGAATFGVTSASPGNYVTLAIAVLNSGSSTAVGNKPSVGPGVSPSKNLQFQASPRGFTTFNPLIIAATPGTWSWGLGSATFDRSGVKASIKQPGPGVGPFSNNQFLASPRSQTSPPASATIVSATPGTWTWTQTSQSFTQLVNATAGTWSWGVGSASFTQLINATAGTWSWAGSTQSFSQLINASPGTFQWDGSTQGIVSPINATPGTWSWAGSTASFGSALNATPGLSQWDGSTQTFTQLISATPGTSSWAGSQATFSQLIAATAGGSTWSGSTATFTQLLNTTPGTWQWQVTAQQILSLVTVSASPGTWQWDGSAQQIIVGSGAGRHRKKFRNELGDFDSRAEADAALEPKPQPKPAPRIKPATTPVEPVRSIPAPVQLPRISPVVQAVQKALADIRMPLPRDTRDDEAIAKAIVSAMRADQEAIKGLRGALITLASLRRRR
jgi:hypothetical protein